MQSIPFSPGVRASSAEHPILFHTSGRTAQTLPGQKNASNRTPQTQPICPGCPAHHSRPKYGVNLELLERARTRSSCRTDCPEPRENRSLMAHQFGACIHGVVSGAAREVKRPAIRVGRRLNPICPHFLHPLAVVLAAIASLAPTSPFVGCHGLREGAHPRGTTCGPHCGRTTSELG